MKKKIGKLLSAALAACCLLGLTAPAARAAETADATIDASAKASLSLYKYDWTNASNDGVWDDSYVSTGVYDQDVNDALGSDGNSYAVEGVEFSYLKVADIVTYSATGTVTVLYGMDKTASADLLKAIGLENGKDAYAPAAGKLDSGNYYYESNTLVNALRAALAADPTRAKNALEKYMQTRSAAAMPLTDNKGFSSAAELPLGLYLLVETKVPETVTSTTNPFFVSLPMTAVNGTNATDGGQRWIYDVTVYPKNETGTVALEKTVREAYGDTAKHTGSLTDITDGYAHNATASTGDTVDYQIISTLPTITSNATALAEYTFTDALAAGLTYTKGDIKLEWFTARGCDPTSKVAVWTEADGKFSVAYSDGDHTMKISMTAAGLAEINTAADAYANVNNNGNVKYAGYSNYTVRVTYTAKLDADNTFVCGDAANANAVTLNWRRTSGSYSGSVTDDCHVYAYGVDLTKVFAEVTPEQANTRGLYAAVKFSLKNTTDNYWVQAELNEAEGVYYVTGHAAAEADAAVFVPVTQPSADGNAYGKIVIKGLEDDAYTLTELETASGYTLLKDSVAIEISAAADTARPCAEGHDLLTASASVDGDAVTMTSAGAMAPLTVVNTRGFDLPETGDVGMRSLPLAGTAMAVSALGLLFPLLKKRDQV